MTMTKECAKRPQRALAIYRANPSKPTRYLVKSFCDSRAFEGGTFWLIQALEKSRGRLPGVTSMVCRRSLDYPSTEAFEAAKLIFRTYQQHHDDEWASHTLDMIDRLCLEGDPSLGVNSRSSTGSFVPVWSLVRRPSDLFGCVSEGVDIIN